MADLSFDLSFNEDESKFYSDCEYEEFLKNVKESLQLLDSTACPDGSSCSKSSCNTDTEILCGKSENCIDDDVYLNGKDPSHNIADQAYKTKAENSSRVADENVVHPDEDDSDLQFENFITDLKKALDKDDESEPPIKSADSSDDLSENSEEENMFEKFLTQMNDKLEIIDVSPRKTSEVLQPRNALPLKSQSLSSETGSTDKKIHPRSQSASRICEFNLGHAKAQAEHDFMLKRKTYAEQMYHFFNKKVFNDKLPQTALLKWNGKMKSTAGFCKCTRKNTEYFFHIELSPCVLISFDRLQDTLIHEMCHAACWMINHSRDNHGQLWRTWADRCNLILPEVEVPTRCHSYQLSYAYVLKCTKCAFERKRHKMCEKLQRTVCPICRAPTELKRL